MSSGGATYSSGLYGSQINLLRGHPAVAFALPHPDVQWTRDDVPDMVSDIRRRLQSNQIIEVIHNHARRKDDCNLYRTKPAIYNYIHENLSEPRLMPCGHAGLRNLGDGRYTCQRDACDAEFDRVTTRRAMFE